MLWLKVLVIVVVLSIPTVLLAYLMALFDFIFTSVPSGQIKVIMKAESFHMAIPNIDGRTIDHVSGDIIPLKPGDKDPNKSLLNNLFGLWLVGIPVMRSVFHYKFRWPKIRITGRNQDGSTEFEIDNREEDVKTVFWRYNYPVTSMESEVIGNIPYDIDTLATIEIVNPRKALFDVQPPGEWLTKAMGEIIDAIRKYASKRTVDDLRQDMLNSTIPGAPLPGGTTPATGTPAPAVAPGKTAKPKNTSFEKEVMDRVNGKRKPGKLVTDFGVRLSAINLLSIKVHDPTGDNDLTKAVTAEVVAKKKADAVRAKADGDAYEIEKVGAARAKVITDIAVADAKRVETVILKAAGLPGGAEVLMFEAQRDGMKESRAGTLVFGQMPNILINSTNTPVKPTMTSTTPPPPAPAPTSTP